MTPFSLHIPYAYLPRPRAGSRLFRWQFLEALPPETRSTANARGVSARRQDLALRVSAHGPCDARDGDAGRNRSSRLFPKAGRSRKHGSPRPPKEGGAPWGGSPKQHPPSPVWKTQLQTRQIDFRQALREPRRSDTPGSGGLPCSIPALERAIPFETRSRPAGQSPTLRQGAPLRQAGREPPHPDTPPKALSPRPCHPAAKGLRCACGLLSERR